MRVLGLHLHKGALRFAVVEGTRQNPQLIASGRLVTPDPEQVPALMDWCDSQFRRLIDDYGPEHVAYRLTLDPDKEQLFYAEFPMGVLNLVAHQRDLPVNCLSSKSFTPSRLGMGKGTDLYDECDRVFGEHPPYWDSNQKHAVLMAWFSL